MPRNKALIVLLALFAVPGALRAENEAPLSPARPQIMGQGGCPVATATGFDALFVNPAGFATAEGQFTFYASSFWLYADPIKALRAIVSPSGSFQDYMDDQITSGGFGFGSCDGIGYVGKGIAAAVLLNIDSYVWGPDVASATGQLVLTVSFVSGFAHSVQLRDLTLTLGFDIRPMIRILAPIDELVMEDFVKSIYTSTSPLDNLDSYNALHGTALAMDLGAIFEWEGLRWGIAVRDFLGTRFKYKEDTVGDILDSFGDSGGFPTGGTEVDDHKVPMDISSGFAYTFSFDSGVVNNLTLHWALCDIIAVATEERPPAAMMHGGIEMELFRALTLRGGFNQGYLTFGLGARASLLDFNLAYFTREMGTLTDKRASSGFTLELAFRRDEARRKERLERKAARKAEAGEPEEEGAEGPEASVPAGEEPAPEQAPADQ